MKSRLVLAIVIAAALTIGVYMITHLIMHRNRAREVTLT
jgi:phage shock protein PspC (stress-responsive transcriptional regulator)